MSFVLIPTCVQTDCSVPYQSYCTLHVIVKNKLKYFSLLPTIHSHYDDQIIFKYSLSKDPLPIRSAHDDTDLYEVPVTLYQHEVSITQTFIVPVTLYQYKHDTDLYEVSVTLYQHEVSIIQTFIECL